MSNFPPPPPPDSPYGPAATPPLAGGANDAKGFFGALFDFGFNSFVTPKIVKVVYVVFTVLTLLAWVFYLLVAFSQSGVLGVLVLIFGPILVILYMAFFRMILEMYYAIIRMSEDIHRWTPSQ